MAKARAKHAEGTEEGGSSSEVAREGGSEDPRGVLLSTERLVIAAGDAVRRLRHLRSRGLENGWADEGSLGEMAGRLEEVRTRLTRLRDQVARPD